MIYAFSSYGNRQQITTAGHVIIGKVLTAVFQPYIFFVTLYTK